METSDIKHAIAAATSTAASLGLSADDATVLHNSNRLTLRLTPCDVVARVASGGQESAQFEVDLAQRLAAAGCPVGTVESRVTPQVYPRHGFVVTLWTYYEPSASSLSPADYARALELLDRRFLSGRLADLRRVIEERGAVEQLLHGEPHPGNVLNTTDRPLFIDLETCCRGPVEFDLAHVPEEVGEYYPNVDRGLLDDCRQLVLAMLAAWRFELGDRFPQGRFFGEEFLRVLRSGPPWPTLDAVVRRLNGPSGA